MSGSATVLNFSPMGLISPDSPQTVMSAVGGISTALASPASGSATESGTLPEERVGSCRAGGGIPETNCTKSMSRKRR